MGTAHYYRGLIYDEMDQLEQAIAAYQTAIRLDPELEDAYEALKSALAEFEEAGYHLILRSSFSIKRSIMS